jgi:hypothetical protein
MPAIRLKNVAVTVQTGGLFTQEDAQVEGLENQPSRRVLAGAESAGSGNFPL